MPLLYGPYQIVTCIIQNPAGKAIEPISISCDKAGMVWALIGISIEVPILLKPVFSTLMAPVIVPSPTDKTDYYRSSMLTLKMPLYLMISYLIFNSKIVVNETRILHWTQRAIQYWLIIKILHTSTPCTIRSL